MLAVQRWCRSGDDEGLSDSGEVADLQAEFEARNAAQCGYCTPGMVITSPNWLRRAGRRPRGNSRSSVRQFCRCTGYQAIIDTVEETTEEVEHVTWTVTVMGWSARRGAPQRQAILRELHR